MIQWLGFRTFTAEGPGSIPGRGTKIPQAMQHGQKKGKTFLGKKDSGPMLLQIDIQTFS